MKWLSLAIGVIAVLLVFFLHRSHDGCASGDCSAAKSATTDDGDHAGSDDTSTAATSQSAADVHPLASANGPGAAMDAYNKAHALDTNTRKANAGAGAGGADTGDQPSTTRDYTVEDGVAVIDGDVVIGLPGSAGRAAQLPPLTPWPTTEIPYFIQPSVPDPGRIVNAMSYFNDTAIRFVPVTNQQDVLVFENATGKCKSYMGKIGGKQPVYLAPNCGPHEIAHELMHALGFIHEQNRTDRDGSIRVNRDNIIATALVNFEKFPTDFMLLSGLAPFDYTSIMLYPPSMFSRNGEPTMTALTSQIQPSERLSPSDIARVNAYYGSR